MVVRVEKKPGMEDAHLLEEGTEEKEEVQDVEEMDGLWETVSRWSHKLFSL